MMDQLVNRPITRPDRESVFGLRSDRDTLSVVASMMNSSHWGQRVNLSP